MPLSPDEESELEVLEAELAHGGGRGVELADDIDRLRRLRDLPHRPEEIRRRLVAEYPVRRAADRRVALWSLLDAALIVRAERADAAFVAVEETDQDLSGSLVLHDVLDADGDSVGEDVLADDDDLLDALNNLNDANRDVWGDFAVDDGTGRDLRLDVGRILDAVAPASVGRSYPETFALAEDESVLEVGFSYGLTGTKDWGAGAWHFAAKANVRDAEEALRAAVAEYLARPGANPNGYYFNWGDAVDEVPEEVWARHGLRPLDVPVQRSIDVDHDEVLASPPGGD